MAQYIFKAFNKDEDIIAGKQKRKTFPIWTDIPTDDDTNQESIMEVMYTQSSEVSNWEGYYYYNIFNQDTASNANAEAQFSIAFGTTQSIKLDGVDEEYRYTYPSKAIYGQFVNSLKEGSMSDGTKLFTSASVVMSPIYIISIARSRIKDGIELDTWQLNLSGSSGMLNLINAPGYTSADEVVPIITGYITGTNVYDVTYGISSASNGIQMGLLYPQRGVFIFDALKIHSYIGSGSEGYNPNDIILSGSYSPSASLNNFWEMMKNASRRPDIAPLSSSYFRARTTENVQSTHYFCRIKNYEFNYSTNPSWVSGSNNDVLDEFYSEPRTFITTVGLYDGDNDSGQLVAVAKLSRPIPKDGESEALIKIQLQF